MKNLYPVSRWITIQGKYITPRHSLWNYGEKETDDDKKRYLLFFRYGGREYAFAQFIARFGAWGFDQKCERYPAFITGYDGDGDLYSPLLCSIDEYGEKIRLFLED